MLRIREASRLALPRLRSGREPKLSVAESEELANRYFQEFKDNRHLGVFFILRHPRFSVDALTALYRLPIVDARLSSSLEGAAVRRGLYRTSPLGRTIIHAATAVLALPDRAEDYTVGASKQTLRRKIRAAQKQGVHWVRVTDHEQRRALLQLANDQERFHELEAYRSADPQNDDLLDSDLWLLALTADDRPLLLSVTPVDGEWAVLRYFRVFGTGDVQANSRYLMTQVLVDHLVPMGVRYLADTSSPVGLTNGLRHFQRMLGFRVVRVRLSEREPATAGPATS